MKKKIAVVGGLGFLGSHLVHKLYKDNDIAIIDSLETGSMDNIKDIKDEVSVTISPIESVDTEQLEDKIDEIYHAGSIASPPIYQKKPLITASANSIGTYKVLELAKKCGAKVLFFSTSEIYGDPLEHPQKETYLGNVQTLGPRSCYDSSKRFGEMMCWLFKDKVDVKIVRLFNTYGPNMPETDGRVITNFIYQLLKGKPLTIYGKGTQTRSFLAVDDCIDGLLTIMNKGKSGEAYNLGNPEEVSILTLANTITKLFGKDPAEYPAIFHRLPKDDPIRRCPVIAKISKLGWKPTISLEDGLRKTINNIKEKKCIG